MKEQVERHVDRSDDSAIRKAHHYIRMLDAQLVAGDKTEAVIDDLSRPYPARHMGETFRDDE